MEKYTEIEHALSSIKKDIKAEVLVAELFDNQIAEEDIFISLESAFKRSFRKDLTQVKKTEINTFDIAVKISLARDGMYDKLPEGLFHVAAKNSTTQVSNMVSEYKRFKNEEAIARKFFAPYENEFFLQQIKIEQQEKKFYYKINLEKNEFLKHFWKLDAALPKNAAKRLIEFMPFAGEICGNKELMQNTLAKILDEKVELKINSSPTHFYYKDEVTEEKNTILGNTTLIGNTVTDELPELEFCIGPLKQNSITDYLPQQTMYKILTKFYDCFVPLEAEIKTTFVANKSENQMPQTVLVGYNFEL